MDREMVLEALNRCGTGSAEECSKCPLHKSGTVLSKVNCFNELKQAAKEVIESSVQVVRCGECKHWYGKEGETKAYCPMLERNTNYVFFCADGTKEYITTEPTIDWVDKVTLIKCPVCFHEEVIADGAVLARCKKCGYQFSDASKRIKNIMDGILEASDKEEKAISTYNDIPEEIPEIIRCRDCKYFSVEDWWDKGPNMPIIIGNQVPTCHKWGGGCATNRNGFCHLAERRDVE